MLNKDFQPGDEVIVLCMTKPDGEMLQGKVLTVYAPTDEWDAYPDILVGVDASEAREVVDHWNSAGGIHTDYLPEAEGLALRTLQSFNIIHKRELEEYKANRRRR